MENITKNNLYQIFKINFKYIFNNRLIIKLFIFFTIYFYYKTKKTK